jgi:hypothetical protein
MLVLGRTRSSRQFHATLTVARRGARSVNGRQLSLSCGLAGLEFWRSDLDRPPLLHSWVLTVCGLRR